MNKTQRRLYEEALQQSYDEGVVLTNPSAEKYVRMSSRRRRELYPEIYGWFDPDLIAAQIEAPPEVMVAFREVFQDWANPKLFDPTRPGWVKLVMHPHFKRWTIFEWTVLPYIPGQPHRGMAWRPLYISCGPIGTGELPPDLKTTDGRYDELRGSVGPYHLPNKEDFWMVREIGDKSLNTEISTTLKSVRDSDKHEKEVDRIRGDKLRDILDYYFNYAVRDANREFGSMQGFHKIPQTSLNEVEKEKEKKYNIEEVKDQEGYLLYKKKSKKKHIQVTPPKRVLTEDGKFVSIAAEIPAEAESLSHKTVDRLLAGKGDKIPLFLLKKDKEKV